MPILVWMGKDLPREYSKYSRVICVLVLAQLASVIIDSVAMVAIVFMLPPAAKGAFCKNCPWTPQKFLVIF